MSACDELQKTTRLADELVNFAMGKTNTPREALMALVRAASTVSIIHQIPPKEVLAQIMQTMSN